MKLMQQITADTLQTQTFILDDGSSFVIQLYFIPMQYCWIIKSLTYNNFTLQGYRITVSGNILHQYRNQIPFGIACLSKANRDPSQQQDFSSGAAQLYVLNSSEVTTYNEILTGVVSV